jgi:hypothetical protein
MDLSLVGYQTPQNNGRVVYGVLETINFCPQFELKQTETQSVLVVFRFIS